MHFFCRRCLLVCFFAERVPHQGFVTHPCFLSLVFFLCWRSLGSTFLSLSSAVSTAAEAKGSSGDTVDAEENRSRVGGRGRRRQSRSVSLRVWMTRPG